MLCSICSTENPDGARDCVACGGAMPAPCPRCRHISPATAKFCSECGERLAAAPVGEIAPPPGNGGGERRHLTVLFCDLVNSTQIASRLDPEQWHAIAAEYQQAAGEAARRMGGYVAKYL